jgi:hypothetical protein
MKIEIDDDTMDTIIQSALVEDYVSLTNDLKNNKSMHEDDVEAYKETVAGIEILAKWYFVHGEFEKAVKKARKVK